MSFLVLFFRNLIMGENNELKNRTMIINPSQHVDRTSTEQANQPTQCSTYSNYKNKQEILFL